MVANLGHRDAPLFGLYRCGCGNFRWERMSRTAPTTVVPACHGYMRFTWTLLDSMNRSSNRDQQK
jgi:hypothetical protein